MDIFAHGLWTNIIFEIKARKEKRKRNWRETISAIFFGIAPDLFSFGILFIQVFGSALFLGTDLGFVRSGPPDHSMIPEYVPILYNLTHSMVIFLLIFGFVWIIRRKVYWPLAGWGLHIFIDIWSHTKDFYATPFLFPFSEFKVSGVSWGHPTFMIINYSALILVYLLIYLFKKSRYAQNKNYQKQ